MQKKTSNNKADVAAAAKETKNDGQHSDGSKAMSRGQRKRLEKTAKVMRKKGVVISNDKKKPAADSSLFSEIESSLSEDTNVRPAASNTNNVSSKIMKNVAIREVERMKLVQQHPQFVQDPIATMKAHFTQMIAAQVKSK